MKNISDSFTESLQPVHEIELVKIEPDPAVVARYLARARELREAMGPRWVGHKLNAAQHREQSTNDVRDTIRRARAALEAVRQHQNVLELKRKASA